MWYVVDDADTPLSGPYPTRAEGIDGIQHVASQTSEVVRLAQIEQ